MAKNDYDLMALSDAELNLRLGTALYEDDFGSISPTDMERRRRAERWFALQLHDFQRVVCGNAYVKRYAQSKDAVERELFDAVVSALAALTGIPVPVGVLAAKIVRFGVANLCPMEQDVGTEPGSAS